MDAIFDFLSEVDTLFWGQIAFIMIILLGCYLTVQARFFQIRSLPSIVRTFFGFLNTSSAGVARGVHPLKAFFASVGGMIGIGNVVGIVTAIQIGGPGALFWVWISALIGAVIKYSEIYLGIKYRVLNDRGGYDGGPMYFLREAFKSKWIPIFISSLLCVYGVEIYQFAVITESLSVNFGIERMVIIPLMLVLILYAGIGGVPRIGKICSWIMPLFMVLYTSMSIWVICQHVDILPGVLMTVFDSAFNGHAAVGGFAGSTALLAIQHGVSRAAYSADLGIGYDSIIQSESSTAYPESQARLAVLGVFVDNLVCTMSILVVLLSGVWQSTIPTAGSQLVQSALSQYFPYMELFMPLFLFIVGYSTMIAYFCVGLKCARFLHPEWGTKIYIVYGVVMLVLFSFLDQTQALLIMSLSGAMLLMTNLLGIFKLRHQVQFVEEIMSPQRH